MKIEWHEESGFNEQSVVFRITKDEFSRLSEYDRERIMALKRRGRFEDVIELLSMIEEGSGYQGHNADYFEFDASSWSGYEDLLNQFRESAGNFYDAYVHGSQPPPYQHSNAKPEWATVLDVPANASQDDIKKAYRVLAKKHHPDAGGDPVRFQQIQKAYEQAKR